MRDKIIQFAQSQIGIKEDPPGTNCVKFNNWFYEKTVKGPDYPWCGVFVSWVYSQSGVSLPDIGYLHGYASCQYAMNNIHKWGQIIDRFNVKPGDVVFFDWNNDKHFDHTGIFIHDLGDNMFESIEGNTGLGNDSNGGEVMKRTRRYSVATFVRPNVLDVTA